VTLKTRPLASDCVCPLASSSCVLVSTGRINSSTTEERTRDSTLSYITSRAEAIDSSSPPRCQTLEEQPTSVTQSVSAAVEFFRLSKTRSCTLDLSAPLLRASIGHHWRALSYSCMRGYLAPSNFLAPASSPRNRTIDLCVESAVQGHTRLKKAAYFFNPRSFSARVS
jgi:hypothetical protein